MPAVWFRFRVELRRRLRAWAAVAVVVGLAGGAVLSLVAGARRTDSAYDRFVRATDGYDVLVSLNVSGFGAPETRTFEAGELTALPQVAEAAETGSFFVLLGAGVGVLVPPDERIGTTINRFKMLEGRRADPKDPTEVVISFTLAEQHGLQLGSKIEVIDQLFLGPPPPSAPPEEVAVFTAARDRVLAVLPDNAFTVVGIEASAGEFPPQIEGTGRYLIHASPALYPLRSDLGLLSEGSDLLMVRLKRGAVDTDSFLAELERLGAREGIQLTIQRDLTDVVNRSVHTQALALQLLALLTAFAGTMIVGQLITRLTYRESRDHDVLSALGMGRGQRGALGLGRAAVIGATGALLAVAVAAVASPLFPNGLAGTAEPNSGFHIDGTVVVAGALIVTAIVLAIAGWPTWRAGRLAADAGPGQVHPTLPARLLAGTAAPLPVTTGVRMALEPGSGRDAVPVRSSLVGATLGMVTLVAAITFGAGLGHLLATPTLYGQTWDFELTTYDETLATFGVSILENDDRVEGLAVANVRAAFDVGGRRVDGLVLVPSSRGVTPRILEGRQPRGEAEIAAGTRTLRSLGIGVGDDIAVAPFAEVRKPGSMRVVGRAVFPVFGEAGSLGDGVFMNEEAWRSISGAPLDRSDTSLLIRLASGADIESVVQDLEAALEGTPVFLIGQGKPTDLVNFGRVQATPYILGAVLAVISVATLAHLLVSTIRRRRRDVAILKTLGFHRRQVLATIGSQATTLIAIALVVGVPLGIAAGRWIWLRFADELGVVAVAPIPLIALAILLPLAVVVANLAAAGPAISATRLRPAVVLRSE